MALDLLARPWQAPSPALERLLGDDGAQVDRVADALVRRLGAGERLSILIHGPQGSGRALLAAAASRKAADSLRPSLQQAWIDGRLAGGPPVSLLTAVARTLVEKNGDPGLVGRVAALFDLPSGAAEKATMSLLDDLIGGDRLLIVIAGVDFLPASVPYESWLHVAEWIARNPRVALVGLAEPIERRRVDLDFEAWFSPLGGHAETFRARPVERAAAPALAAAVWSLGAGGRHPPEDLPIDARILRRLTGGRRRWFCLGLAERWTGAGAGTIPASRRLIDRLGTEIELLLERISPQQRRLLATLALARQALTVRELARRCFCSSQAVSSQLGMLRGSGLVSAERDGRQTWYRLADPLLSSWLELRAGSASELERELRLIDAMERQETGGGVRALASLFAEDPGTWRERIPRLIDSLRREGRPGALAAALARLALDGGLPETDPGRLALWRDLWAEWSSRDDLVAGAVRLLDATVCRLQRGPVPARARLSPLMRAGHD